MMTYYAFALAIWYQAWNLQLTTKQWIGYISVSTFNVITYSLAIYLPDTLMVIVGRIYFTECYLYAKAFVHEFETMQVEHIINSNLLERYMEMFKKIEADQSLFYLWIMDLLLQLVMASWHAVSTYTRFKTSTASVLWLSFIGVEASIYIFMALFVLWPAMLMTEKVNRMKELIHEKLTEILKCRLHFHDELILGNLMNAIMQRQNEFLAMDQSMRGKKYTTTSSSGWGEEIEMKTMERSYTHASSMRAKLSGDSGFRGDEEVDVEELCKSLMTHSKQERALEILNRLKYLIKKHSCCYELLGVEIDRSSIRDFVIALVVTNILSFMWDSLDES